MAAANNGNHPQQNEILNGINGTNGDDDIHEEQPQPSTSGLASAVEPPLPTLDTLCIRGLYLCRRLLTRVAKTFAARQLGQQTLDAIYQSLTVIERATVWANAAANKPQSIMWYVLVPISMFLMVAKTGVELAERYLDIQLPENQHFVNWLQDLRNRLKELQESAVKIGSGTEKVPETSPSSSTSSMSLHDEQDLSSSEEEPLRPPTPGDKSMYYSVGSLEQSTEQEKGTEQGVEKADDDRGKADGKGEKLEEKPQEGEIEEQRPAVVAEEEKADTGVFGVQPSAPPEFLLSADEAERAAMSVTPQQQPPAHPASSEALLGAEGSSQAEPGTNTSTSAEKQSSKVPKGMFFFNLFGAKLG